MLITINKVVFVLIYNLAMKIFFIVNNIFLLIVILNTKHVLCILINYCKRITFGDVFFLAPLAVDSTRQIKYTANCAFRFE